jgi:4-amino-4-deoxy-L-arabinose transferase-like glycosyltransferase
MRWGACLLLLVLFAQLVAGARHLSLTSDEPAHVAAGLTFLTTGELWVPPQHGHPPLLNAWAALPLLLQSERPELRTVDGWGSDFSTFVRSTWPLLGPVQRQTFLTRLPVMFLTMLLAAVVYRWASDALGTLAAAVALWLMAFDPNLVAHGQLATTDLGLVLAGTATLFVAWRAVTGRTKRGLWTSVVWIGVLLGLAMSSKGSGMLYLPAVWFVLTWEHVTRWCRDRRISGYWSLIVRIAIVTGVAFTVLWASYRFEVGTLPGSRVWLPFPSHFRLLQRILKDVERTAFLRGETKVGGWWWYFLYTTAVKTPIPLLVAMVWAAVAWLRRGAGVWWRSAPLIVFPALYWVVAVRSQMNIGHRHMLPTFPFIYLAVASAVVRLRTSPARWRLVSSAAASALLVWIVVEAAAVYPYGLAYFNQLAGGPERGYLHLSDSNVDWGQSFVALASYMQEQGVDRVRLAYYTNVDPMAYGVAYEPLPPATGVSDDVLSRFAPQPSVYAIGATPFQGVMMAQPELYDWFSHREPDAMPGYGILVYTVRPADVEVDWVAQCSNPITPLPEDEVVLGEGKRTRISYFDCSAAWLYPGGGETPGHYVLASDDALLDRPFVAARLRPARLVYEQAVPGALPAFMVYRSEGNGLDALNLSPSRAAPSSWMPAEAEARGVVVTVPARLDGPLWFLGAISTRPQIDVVELDTYWRVVSAPMGRPLSIMAHILAADGTLVVGDDGLGVPIDQWRIDDVILQHHVLSLPPDGGMERLWLQTGVYWLDTLERWEVSVSGDGVGDRFLIGEVPAAAG